MKLRAQAFATAALFVAATLGHLGASAGTFPGANGKIAFASSGHINVINGDGTGRVTLDAASPASSVAEPAWNATGKKIAYRAGGSEIRSISATGTNSKALVGMPSFAGNPTWSADGSVVAFDGYIGGPQQENRIYVVPAAGGTATELVDLDAMDPTYSPDGTKIAYEESAGESDIGVMNADGSGAANITTGTGGNNSDHDPSWSPDGTKIAFTRGKQIWTMSANGSGAIQLTTGTDAEHPTWSPDGTKIAFERDEDIWVMDGDGSDVVNITNTPEVEDREPDWGIPAPGTVVCSPPATTDGNAASGGPAISADGRVVAFTSNASNLVAGDSNGVADVFVHDRDTGATTRVSVASDGTQANVESGGPAISADGRVVAFTSGASNLVAGDTNSLFDVFVHSRDTGATTRVSVASDGAQGIYDNPWTGSRAPDISADGRFVGFSSTVYNLVAGDTNDKKDVFVHDRDTGVTTRVSVGTDGNQGNVASGAPAISADGRVVAFESSFGANGAGLFVRDRSTGVTTRVSVASGAGGRAPDISADGRLVAFHSYASNLVAGDTNNHYDLFVHDRDTGATTRVSVASDGTQANRGTSGAAGPSGAPAISADGRLVAFDSESSNLVAGDTNNYTSDVFVHDRDTAATTTVSVASDGNQGNGASGAPDISADGRFVAFSTASNLVAGDTNGVQDVFVHERSTGATTRVSVASDVFRPDAQIKIKTSGRYVGDDVYNLTGAGQNKSLRIPPGGRAVFTIAVQNDGNTIDSYRLKGPGAQPGFTATYRSGGRDVTRRVVAGTFTLTRLDPCAAETIELVVTAKAAARFGTTRPWLITATSASGAHAVDAVKATLHVR